MRTYWTRYWYLETKVFLRTSRFSTWTDSSKTNSKCSTRVKNVDVLSQSDATLGLDKGGDWAKQQQQQKPQFGFEPRYASNVRGNGTAARAVAGVPRARQTVIRRPLGQCNDGFWGHRRPGHLDVPGAVFRMCRCRRSGGPCAVSASLFEQHSLIARVHTLPAVAKVRRIGRTTLGPGKYCKINT